MARLVTEMLKKRSHQVWLDQLEMQRTTTPTQVVRKIAEIFLKVPQVIILAGPGDWLRFSDCNDIHRWEWEVSLRSGKSSFRCNYIAQNWSLTRCYLI